MPILTCYVIWFVYWFAYAASLGESYHGYSWCTCAGNWTTHGSSHDQTSSSSKVSFTKEWQESIPSMPFAAVVFFNNSVSFLGVNFWFCQTGVVRCIIIYRGLIFAHSCLVVELIFWLSLGFGSNRLAWVCSFMNELSLTHDMMLVYIKAGQAKLNLSLNN